MTPGRLPVIWSATARDHLSAITAYISYTSPVYAERMLERIIRRVGTLAEFPLSGRLVPEARGRDVRELVVPPYRILYLAQADRVDVLAIIHGRQQLRWPNTPVSDADAG